jgi:hypothetical protein
MTNPSPMRIDPHAARCRALTLRAQAWHEPGSTRMGRHRDRLMGWTVGVRFQRTQIAPTTDAG